jgi:hypothetical protein
MTIKELKDLISSIPDDFIFEIEVEKEVTKNELMQRTYPYPIDTQRCEVKKENHDIGWSDGKMKLELQMMLSNSVIALATKDSRLGEIGDLKAQLLKIK